MTLEEFDALMVEADIYVKVGRSILAEATRIEMRTLMTSGVYDHNREPGFPNWTYDGAGRYFNTPREAMEAKCSPQ